MSKHFNWFGVLMIAIASGLIVKIVGDPIVEVTTPALADVLDDWGDRLEETMEDFEDWLTD